MICHGDCYALIQLLAPIMNLDTTCIVYNVLLYLYHYYVLSISYQEVDLIWPYVLCDSAYARGLFTHLPFQNFALPCGDVGVSMYCESS